MGPSRHQRQSHGTGMDGDGVGHTMVMERGLQTMVMERGLQNLFLMLMLRLNRGIMAAMDTDGPTTDTATMEKDLLMPSLPQMLMPSLSHGIMAVTDGHTTVVIMVMVRGLPMLNLPQMP